MKLLLPYLWAISLALCGLARGAEPTFQPTTTPPSKIKERYDVVIAGAGTGGVGAAIQAARLGASVLLLEETDWIGGQMNAAAVTSMDEGTDFVQGRGLYRELVGKIHAHYDPLEIDPETAYHYGRTCTEPRVGRKILHDWLAEEGKGRTLDLVLRAKMTKALKSGDTITGVEIEAVADSGTSKRTVQSKILIDATEWGDVIPLTGARYRVGNCTSDAIDMKKRVQDNTWTAVVRQYPGEVPSGFLLTQAPPDYAKAHPRFVKSLDVGDGVTISSKLRPWNWVTFIGYRGMPDSKRPPGSRPITRTHLNFNNDYNSTVAEIEDLAQRQKTDREMRLRTLQLVYYIQNTLGMKDWAVADDEGYDTPYNRAEIDAWLRDQPELEPFRKVLYHFPVIPYVRESRRIIGVHTLSAPEIDRRPGKQPIQFPTSVAIGDYPVDMHGSMTPQFLELEFDPKEHIPEKFGAHGKGPFAIPFESFIPEKVDGFLPAEKNISQSRMGNGATRLQPHTMLMGQAAGAIAALSVKYNLQPRELDPVLVQRMLADARDPLNFVPLRDVASDNPDWAAIQLVTARGMLPLVNGKFGPQEPVTPDELSVIQEKLSSPKPVQIPETTKVISRVVFASALQQAMSDRDVTVDFTALADEQVKPITRSEAAQVISELLELQALAKLTRSPKVLAWNSVRPASVAAKTDVTSTIERDVRKLVAAKIITSPGYWLENAVEGGVCEGQEVAALLQRAAKAFDADVSPENAVPLLAQKHIFGSPDYWSKNTAPGRTCTGNNVARVIRNLARSSIARGRN